MQPYASITHPIAASHATAAVARNEMTTPAAIEAGWPLRNAQRAFAVLLEEVLAGAATGAFRTAQLRSAARRTLCALSAEDVTRLSRWLALQLATVGMHDAERAWQWLARVDTMVAANIGTELPRVREELEKLFTRRQGDDAVAA